MNKDKLHKTIMVVTDLLAKEGYGALAEMSKGIRLNKNEIKMAVFEYGRKITPLSEQNYDEIDIIEVNNSKPRQWSVNVPIYTVEEGLSDLTLELTLIETPEELYGVEIDDLHVL